MGFSSTESMVMVDLCLGGPSGWTIFESMYTSIHSQLVIRNTRNHT